MKKGLLAVLFIPALLFIGSYGISALLFEVGSLMNGLVVKSNGGEMPVFKEFETVEEWEMLDKIYESDPDHKLGHPNTKYPLLADWIVFNIRSNPLHYFLAEKIFHLYGKDPKELLFCIKATVSPGDLCMGISLTFLNILEYLLIPFVIAMVACCIIAIKFRKEFGI